MRAWLRVTRLQTAGFTVAISLLGYYLAGGKIFSVYGFYILLFSLLFHACGHLDNNVCDLKYDLRDPSKKHFPLVSGEILFERARKACYLALWLIVLSGLFLSNGSLASIFFLVLGVSMGLAYNRVNKRVYWKPIPFALSFISLPCFFYYANASLTTMVFILYCIYGFLALSWELGVGGELKDINNPAEKNILRRLGVAVEDGKIVFSFRSEAYVWSFKVLNYFVGVGVLIFLAMSLVNAVAYWISWGMALFFVNGLGSSGEWNRKRRMRDLVLVELFTYLAVVVALALPLIEAVTMVVFPVAWLITFNRIIWSSGLTPRV